MSYIFSMDKKRCYRSVTFEQDKKTCIINVRITDKELAILKEKSMCKLRNRPFFSKFFRDAICKHNLNHDCINEN
jgi:hypothetical protein